MTLNPSITVLRPGLFQRHCFVYLGAVLFFSWFPIPNAQAQDRLALRNHNGPVSSLAFSPDGKLLVVGSSSGKLVKIWDVATGKEVAALTANDHGAQVAFAPGGKILAVTGHQGPVRLYDTFTWKVRQQLKGSEVGTRRVTFSPDGKTLATVEVGDPIRLWEVASGKDLGFLPLALPQLWPLAYSPDGKLLAAGGWEEAVLWDLAKGKVKTTLVGHRGRVTCVVFSPDGSTLVTVGNHPVKGNILVWDVATGQCRGQLDRKRPRRAEAAAFAPDGKTLAIVGMGVIRLYGVRQGEVWATLELPKAGPWMCGCVAFSPDGRTLAVGCNDSSARLYDVPARK